ncbi:MAG: sulfite exporter TauE/SafE family protein [Desulfovibrio sp.]
MILDTAFWVAFNSSLILGLVHGINPCGHSWIVLAPFVAGDENGKKVAFMTAAFVGGTTLACLAIGMTLGAFSNWLAPYLMGWSDYLTNGIVIAIGGVLLVKPALLHSHDHDHDHDHDHEHDHDHDHGHTCHGGCSHRHGASVAAESGVVRATGMKAWGLFTLGFINMIVPCPTVAIMYSYAVQSGSATEATLVFGSYALGTALSLSLVIYIIFKFTAMMKKLNDHRIENMVMRSIGLLTLAVGVYGLWSGA